MKSLENEKELKTLSKNIVWLRREKRLSKKEMAALLGIGVQSLTRLENGEVLPRLGVSTLFNIQTAFGISPRIIFTQYLGNDENC